MIVCFNGISSSQGKVAVDSRHDLNQTALHIAVIQGHTCIVEELVHHGANVNATNTHHVTPLHALLTSRDTMDTPTDTSPEMLKVQIFSLHKM